MCPSLQIDENSYVPESVKVNESKPLEYEYCFDIASSHDSFHSKVGCQFVLARTKQEAALGGWVTLKIEHGTRYITQTAYDEPKILLGQVAGFSMGISLKEPVQARKIGSGIAQEGFIPIVPTVQVGERLGFPTKGFYYHFHNNKLIQEYKILGDKRWSFYATNSTHHHLDEARGYNKDQSAILVYWKIGGKIVEDQFLVYLERQITRIELDNLNDNWLSKNGIKLNVPELLEATKQPVAQRPKELEEKNKFTAPKHHIVRLDSETGSRESWIKIAQQYSLTPLELLKLNPTYDADPMSLDIGHSLIVEKPQEQYKPEPAFGFPPVKPKIVNHPLNTYYKFSERNLIKDKVESINDRKWVNEDLPILNLKDVTPNKVFAKSCNQPHGCIDAGVEREPITNFGPWSFFFSQANANPLTISATQATQAQLTAQAIASAATNPETKEEQSSAIELEKRGGMLEDRLVKNYRWHVSTSLVLFALRPFMFKDNTQYNEKELRSIGQVQSRIRVQIGFDNVGDQYPTVRAYHVDDTRIPVMYVGMDKDNRYSVILDAENGVTIYWTPTDNGEPHWQTTPNHDDGFEQQDIYVTPIHSNEGNALVNPIPDEKDWRDCILVFPENSGIAPLYIVYSENPRNKSGVVTGKGKDVEWRDGYWLGEAANSGQGQYIPTKIADALRGREFKRFSDLQTAIWKEVANNPELLEQFHKKNKVQIQKGNAPYCRLDYQKGGRDRYEIHHFDQIQYGGEVYNIDNLRINTVKNHIRIHSNEK